MKTGNQKLATRAAMAFAVLALPTHAWAQECIAVEKNAEGNVVAGLLNAGDGFRPYFVAMVRQTPKAVTISPGFSFAKTANIFAHFNVIDGEIDRLTMDGPELGENGAALYLELPYLYENGRWVPEERMSASARWGALKIEPLIGFFRNIPAETPTWVGGFETMPKGYASQIGGDLQIDLKVDGTTRATLTFSGAAVDRLRAADNSAERDLRAKLASGQCFATTL